jgi:hypothetical protein
MKEWLSDGAIDDDPELIADPTGVEYGYVLRDGRDAILLERKDDMKKRGLASPDNADALAVTFAYPVLSRAGGRSGRPGRYFRSNYNPFNYDEDRARYSSPERADAPDAAWDQADRERLRRDFGQ